MGACNHSELLATAKNHKKVLIVVLIINLVMMVVESYFGLIAGSVSLVADAFDMLGDAFAYSISILVVHKSARWHAAASFIKGLIMACFGLGVLGFAIHRFISGTPPAADIMAIVISIALITNFSCLLLLSRHRHEGINMRSSWLCARNDMLSNFGVLLAAGAVALTGSMYPDIIIGIVIASIVLRSSLHVLTESVQLFKN